MADNFLYEKYQYIDHDGAKAEAPRKAAFRFSGIRVRILIVLSIILLAELVWFCIVVPLLPLASVRVNGVQILDRTSVLQIAQIDGTSSWFSVNPQRIQERLSSIPALESVQVTRRFPDTLTLDIRERSRVALVLANSDTGPLFLSLDREGVVYSAESPKAFVSPAQLSMVPLLSGIVFEHPVEGNRLPAFLLPLMKDLSTLASEVPALLRELSEIQVLSKDGLSYELVLFPVREPVRFKTGALLNRDTLTYMMFMLDVLSTNGIKTDEVDLRTGTAVYIPKEDGRGQ